MLFESGAFVLAARSIPITTRYRSVRKDGDRTCRGFLQTTLLLHLCGEKVPGQPVNASRFHEAGGHGHWESRTDLGDIAHLLLGFNPGSIEHCLGSRKIVAGGEDG